MRRSAGFLVLASFCLTVNAGERDASREIAVRMLLDFQQCIQKKDYKKALTFLKMTKELDGKEAEVIQLLAKLRGSSEISKKGVEVLAKKGSWNLLSKLQSEEEAKRMSIGLPLEKCFGLFVGPRRGAAFYWDGSRLFITYFNNIGRLEKE